MSWEKDRVKYIEKLEDSKKAIEYILHIKEKFLNFLDDSLDRDAKRYKEQLDRYIDKLKKDKFEVAIVGLEKAGKSTFANALMGSNFLPEAKQRCTFTTTIVESSRDDIATIEFFSKEEFIKKFDDLLEYIDFKGAKFDSLSLEDIETHLNRLSEIEPRRYEEVSRSDTLDDINSIIENREELNRYLDAKTLELSGESLKGDIRKYIVEESIARAVKEISIKSSNLEGLNNLILYDVPGFDSPTKLHKKQAIDKMIGADAILFIVSVADRVSFVKSQIDVLNQVKDEYGQSLSEKMLIFGNKVDVHTHLSESGIDIEASLREIREYQELLKRELLKYKIYNEKNLFFGSPLAYLEQKEVIESRSSLNKIKSLNLSSGIEEISKRLNQFFNIDRFTILTSILNKLIADIKLFLRDFLEENRADSSESNLTGEMLNFVDEFWFPKRDNLIQKLNQISNELNLKSYDIDSAIKSKISKEWIESLFIDDELIQIYHHKLSSGSIKTEQPEKVNSNIRDSLYKSSISGFIDICGEVIVDKNLEIQNIIKSLIIAEIFGSNQTPTVKKSKESLTLKIDEIVKNYTYDKKSYTPLISRFANDILEILILNPITDKLEGTRVNKFLKSKKNIESIMIFDKNYDSKLNFFAQDLVRRLLIQESIADVEDIKKRLEEELKGFINSNEVEFEKFTEDLSNTIKEKNLSTKKVIKNIKHSPQMLSQDSIEESFDDGTVPNAFENLISNAEVALSYRDVRDEVNEDIHSLEFILNNIVLNAVKIEEPFKHSIEYQIQAIKNDIESGKVIKGFINQNISIIEGEKFSQIENRYKKSQEFNELIEVCSDVIEKL